MTPAALSLRSGVVEALVRRLETPTDPAGLAAFRMLFGLLVSGAALRLLFSGTLDELACDDAFTFRYPGLAWVPVPSDDAVTACTVAFVVVGACIAAGFFFRGAAVVFAVLFAWVELVDLTNYLNHHYLLWLLAVLLALSPANACWSVDAVVFGAGRARVPFFFVALLRFQVGLVYVFAAVAKVGVDWLVAGQPLGLWLPARDGLPIIGPLLAVPAIPLVLSWCGLLYDATIVPLLLWRRTRPFAYAAVVVFHGLTWCFFEIGLFPFIMAVATTIFFSPSWPRRWVRGPLPFDGAARVRVSRVALCIAAVWCVFHVLFPLRCHLIGDDVLWDEAGMRWSWRVMVREKSGSITYRVTLPRDANGKTRIVVVSPHDRLTHRQANEMAGQPDMILQLAHAIRDDFAKDGIVVEVRADAVVSLNGRRAARFIDPDVDLARVDDAFLARPSFVLPAPTAQAPHGWNR